MCLSLHISTGGSFLLYRKGAEAQEWGGEVEGKVGGEERRNVRAGEGGKSDCWEVGSLSRGGGERSSSFGETLRVVQNTRSEW